MKLTLSSPLPRTDSPIVHRTPSGLRASFFAAAAALGLAFSSVYAIPGFPADFNPELQLIESKANAIPSSTKVGAPLSTLVSPATTGYILISSPNLAKALAAALADSSTGTGAAAVSDLIFRAVQYRPAAAAALVTVAVNSRPDFAPEITAAAAAAAPVASVPAIAGAAIKELVLKTNAAQYDETDEVAVAALTVAKQLAAGVATAAIKALAKAPNPTLPAAVNPVTTRLQHTLTVTSAMVAALDSATVGGTFFLEELIKGSVAAGVTLKIANADTSPDLTVDGKIAAAAAGTAGIDSEEAAVIAASALSAIAFKAATPAPFNDAATRISNAVKAARAAGEAAVIGDTVESFRTVKASAKDQGGVVLAGQINATTLPNAGAMTRAAVLAKPAEVTLILNSSLTASNTFGGTNALFNGIIRNAVLGAQTAASRIATTAAVFARTNNLLTPQDVTNVVISNAPVTTYGAVITAVLKNLNTSDSVPDVVTSAVNAAFALDVRIQDGKAGLDDIVKAVVSSQARFEKATPGTLGGLVAAAINAVPTADRTEYSAVITVAAALASKPNATAIRDAALSEAGTPAEEAAITAAFNVSQAILAAPKDFYQIASTQFSLPANSGQALAITYGASLTNPKGAAGIAARATALNPSLKDALRSAAIRTNIVLAPGITLAVETAFQVSSTTFAPNTTGVFAYNNPVSQLTFANPKLAVFVATGAVAAQPNQAPNIIRSVLRFAPTASSTVAPAIFLYANVTANSSRVAKADAASAITSEAVLAIRDAGLGTKQTATIKSATSALVKAAVGQVSNAADFRQGDGATATSFSPIAKPKATAGAVTGLIAQIAGTGTAAHKGVGETDLLIAAIVEAAVKASKLDYLEIVQAAVQTAVAIDKIQNGNSSATTYNIDYIVAAAKKAGANGTKFDYAKIDNVALFARTEIVNNTAVSTDPSLPGSDKAVLIRINGTFGPIAAGAKGIRDFAYNNGNGNAITDISGF